MPSLIVQGKTRVAQLAGILQYCSFCICAAKQIHYATTDSATQSGIFVKLADFKTKIIDIFRDVAHLLGDFKTKEGIFYVRNPSDVIR